MHSFPLCRHRLATYLIALAATALTYQALADSVNSPNITMNVDTNRSTGNGAGDVAVTINTITLAEISLPEYSSGAGRAITIQVRPGFQFDPTSNVTAQSATIGFNGDGINAVTAITPAGTADEILTFELTSGTNVNVQDIIRINGIKLKILSAAGAAGPAQTTMQITTSTAGGAFTNQGIVAANIQKGRADHLEFSLQPGNTQAGLDLLPAVKLTDFGGNLITNDPRTLTLALQANPGSATLLGTTQRDTVNGVATWAATDDLHIDIAATGYTLRATQGGAALQTSDTIESTTFDITAGAPDHLVVTLQPVNTPAGGAIALEVTMKDTLENTVTGTPAEVTLDSAVNPAGWPLLVDTSLTKTTVNGVAAWNNADNLRINAAIAGYKLSASGVGDPIQTNVFDITPATPKLLRFVQQPSETEEGAAIDPAVSVEITDEFANRTDSGAIVDLSLLAACDGDISNNVEAATTGLATFTGLSIDTPCAANVLEASSGNLVRTLSDAFAVTALPPAALRFVQQPTDVIEGEALNPPVSVEIVDETGTRTDSTATVTLTLVSSCGGALSTTTTNAIGGLATFAVLSIDTPCDNVAIQATSGTLTGATSETFDVADADANEDENNAACGVCGQGAAAAMAPLLLMLLGMRGRMGRARQGI